MADQGYRGEDGLFDHGFPDTLAEFVEVSEVFHGDVDGLAEREEHFSPGLEKGVKFEGAEVFGAVALRHALFFLDLHQLREDFVLCDALVSDAHGQDGHLAVFIDGALGHAEDAVGQFPDFAVVGAPGLGVDEDRFGFAEDLFGQVIVEGLEVDYVLFLPEILFFYAFAVQADAFDFRQHLLEVAVEKIFSGDGTGVIADGFQQNAVDEEIVEVALVSGADNDRDASWDRLEILYAAQHDVPDAGLGNGQNNPPDVIRVLLIVMVADLVPEFSFQLFSRKI